MSGWSCGDRYCVIEPINDAYEQLVGKGFAESGETFRKGEIGKLETRFQYIEESARFSRDAWKRLLPNAGPPGFVPPHPDLEARYRK